MENRAKILIGDEDPLNLDFFEVMLSNLGFDIIKASDGEAALEKAVAIKPDLIILDNILPKISGWKVTRFLKRNEEYQDCKDIPIIMLSALDDVRDKIEGFELGVEDYITKPFNFSEVLARIRAVLRHSETSRQAAREKEKLALLGTLLESYASFGEGLKARFDKLRALAPAEKGKSSDSEFRHCIKELEDFFYGDFEILTRERESVRPIIEGRFGGAGSFEDLEKRFQEHLEAWERDRAGRDGKGKSD